MRSRTVLLLLSLLARAAPARANPGVPPAPHDLWSLRKLEPAAGIGLAALAAGVLLVRRAPRRVLRRGIPSGRSERLEPLA